MRTALFAVLFLLALPVQAASSRWQVELYEPMDHGSRTGRLTFERRATLTSWELLCRETVGKLETRTYYQGTAPARRDWVVAEDGGVVPSRLFSLALDRSAPLWLSKLEGCPSAAEPTARRFRAGSIRP